MYSVLIQNKSTIESFQHYHPLFLECLNSSKVGLCRWIESGTTVETALPELTDLIDGKEDWRAIIVRLIDEDVMSDYENSELNPFDFRYYHQDGIPYGESPVPLVRLTHLLGAIPAPEITYEPKKEVVKNEAGKVVRVEKIVYQPVRNEEEERIYRELLDKYEYYGPKPSEIILISLRIEKNNVQDRSIMEETWKTHKEITSSNFWKTNRYSNSCRFITYNMKPEGSVRREADMFKFWLSVLLLINNQMESDELQAYRLYSMDVKFNKDEMQNCFQHTVDRINGAKFYMDQRMKEEDRIWLDAHKVIPEFAMKVPVVVDVPSFKGLDVPRTEFPVVANSNGEDLKHWNDIEKEKELIIKDTVRKTLISLDDSAERMRDVYHFDESRVIELNKYQKKQMDVELQTMYSEIIKMQKELPDETTAIDETLRNAENQVRQNLHERIVKQQVYQTLGLSLLIGILCILPGFVFGYLEDNMNIKVLLSVLLILVDIVAIPIVYTIIKQRREFNEKLGNYNVAIEGNIFRLSENADDFAAFFSKIVSHARGRSYLKTLRSKQFVMGNVRKQILEHQKASESFLLLLKNWDQAFHLDTIFSDHYYLEVEPELGVDPKKNRIYTLDYDSSYTIPLNHSGAQIKSPYEFVSRFELIREELYDYHEHH